MKKDISKTKATIDNDRRREMMKKAHADAKKESLEEHDAIYQKRAAELDKKDNKVEKVQDSWLGGMNAHDVND